MGLKESGLRGSLRNVSTGVIAIPDSVVDNFESILYEDQNLTLSDYYSGDLSVFERQGQTVFNGDFALEIEGQNPGNDGSFGIFSTTGLPRYPEAGEKFNVRLRLEFSENSETRFTFGVQDSSNLYNVDIRSSDNRFRVFVTDGGSTTILDESTAGTISDSVWYTCEVDWAVSGTTTLTLFDESMSQVDQISFNDSTFTSGGIGWRTFQRVGETGSGFVDDFIIIDE